MDLYLKQFAVLKAGFFKYLEKLKCFQSLEHFFTVHMIVLNFWNYFRPCWIWNWTICRYSSFPVLTPFRSAMFIGWFHGFGVKILLFWFFIFCWFFADFWTIFQNYFFFLTFERSRRKWMICCCRRLYSIRWTTRGNGSRSLLQIFEYIIELYRSLQDLTLHVLL